MIVQQDFDNARYGCVHVDFKTRMLHVGTRSLLLSDRVGNLGNAYIAAAFIASAHHDPTRFSIEQITRLSGAKNERAFKSRLSQFRQRLSKFEIAKGVNANSLFLSDRLTGNQTSNNSDIHRKLPYHFNSSLADLIKNRGADLDECDLKGVRLEHSLILGPKSHPVEYRAALGL